MASRNDLFTWTPEATATLIEMRLAGRTYPEIAAVIGAPEAGCIGMAYRLRKRGLIPPVAPPKGRKPYVPRPKKEKATPVRQAKPAAVPLPLPTSGVPFFDLAAHHCRWHIGQDGHTSFFCGEAKHGISSYCPAHHAIVYTRTASRPFVPAKRSGLFVRNATGRY